MALQLSDFGDFAENVLEGFGGQIEASGNDALAKAAINSAQAKLIEQRAKSDAEKTATINKAIMIAVVGFVAVMILWVFGKLILPKILK